MKKIVALLVVLISLCSVASANNAVFAYEDAEYTVHVGKTITPKAIAQGIDGSLTFTWSSSDTDIATVKDGIVKGVSGGTATIVCLATNQDGKVYEAKTTVNVFVPITSISVDKKNVVLAASSEYSAKFSYKTGEQPENEYQMYKPTLTFTPSDASLQQLEWSSGEDMIATVTDDGAIYGISVGTTTITGKAMDGSGKSVKIEVTIPECFVTEDNFTITEPEGAILGYVRPRTFIGSGSGITDLRTKGDADVFAIADLDDVNGMEMMQIVPLKAGEASLLFVRNGKTQKTVNIKVKHSAVYDSVSYPSVKVSSLLKNPEDSLGTKTHVKCEIINIVPKEELGLRGGIVYGMLKEDNERRYVIFECEYATLHKAGDTQTIYGTVSDFVEYTTETGLTYTCPYFTGGHINRF